MRTQRVESVRCPSRLTQCPQEIKDVRYSTPMWQAPLKDEARPSKPWNFHHDFSGQGRPVAYSRRSVDSVMGQSSSASGTSSAGVSRWKCAHAFKWRARLMCHRKIQRQGRRFIEWRYRVKKPIWHLSGQWAPTRLGNQLIMRGLPEDPNGLAKSPLARVVLTGAECPKNPFTTPPICVKPKQRKVELAQVSKGGGACV